MAKTKVKVKIWILRIVLTTLCVLLVGFITYNSAQSGVESSKQSTQVTDTVQNVASVIAPDSFIATATGEDYEWLHEIIRTCAHFLQFALLGALLVWCYFSYTKNKKFLYLPVCFLLVFPFFDEYLQTRSQGRAAELKDIFVDTGGGLCGCIFALITVGLGLWIGYRKRKKRLAENK